jgi:threonine synthase
MPITRVPFRGSADEARAYVEAQGVHKALAEALQQVVEEEAPDAIARMAELLAAKASMAIALPKSSARSACGYLETIGNTPLVELRRCLPAGAKAARVLTKLELNNPGGSLKDRIALHMIEQAEQRGLISPDSTTLVDFTSGNTGIGEAMVAAAKGTRRSARRAREAAGSSEGVGTARSAHRAALSHPHS